MSLLVCSKVRTSPLHSFECVHRSCSLFDEIQSAALPNSPFAISKRRWNTGLSHQPMRILLSEKLLHYFRLTLSSSWFYSVVNMVRTQSVLSFRLGTLFHQSRRTIPFANDLLDVADIKHCLPVVVIQTCSYRGVVSPDRASSISAHDGPESGAGTLRKEPSFYLYVQSANRATEYTGVPFNHYFVFLSYTVQLHSGADVFSSYLRLLLRSERGSLVQLCNHVRSCACQCGRNRERAFMESNSEEVLSFCSPNSLLDFFRDSVGSFETRVAVFSDSEQRSSLCCTRSF